VLPDMFLQRAGDPGYLVCKQQRNAHAWTAHDQPRRAVRR